MAQLDIRNATIRLKDGYSKTGAVSNVGGYPTGTLSMTITGIVGALGNGDIFTLPGDVTVYTITGHVETTGNTTSITFTPGLVVAATQAEVINIGPHILEVKIGDGNLTYSEKRQIEYKTNRGRLDFVRQGVDQPMEVKLDFVWEFLKGATSEPPSIEDALKQRGNASNWVTSDADKCAPYAVDIEVEYDPPCIGVEREIITLPDFRWEDLAHDFKAGQVSVTGKCNSLESAVVRAA